MLFFISKNKCDSEKGWGYIENKIRMSIVVGGEWRNIIKEGALIKEGA